MKIRRSKERRIPQCFSLLLSFVLMLSACMSPVFSGFLSTQAYAVTGSTVAADGTYSGSSSEGTVYVVVSGGKITSVTADVSSKYVSYITSGFSSVVGQDATYDNIDAVSFATKHMNYIKSGALNAIKSASAADGSSSGESSSESEEESTVGQGVGSKTGTKYTGRAYVNGDITDEWVELDVYVSNGKITGIYIAAQDGDWLELLKTIQSSFIGQTASTKTVDAVTSSTTLGFRDTIRNAIFNALATMESSSSSSGTYTECAKGTVSWQMIRDNPGTYYWKHDGEYCALTAVKSSSKYYVTLYRSDKSNGTELRYLKDDKDDDSSSKQDWGSASTYYTGGKLYMLGSTSGASSYTVTFNYNGHGTTTTQTVTAGGTVTEPTAPTASGYTFVGWYTSAGTEYNFNSAVNSSFTLYAKWNVDDSSSGGSGSGSSGSTVIKGSGHVSFSEDDYTFDVYITIEDGKITNITSELTSTPEASKSKTKYHPAAVAAILSALQGKDATAEAVDAISSGTPKYSYKALKAAIIEALGGTVTESQATITMDTSDMTLLEGGTSSRAVTKEGCTLTVSSSDSSVASVAYDSSSNTITVTGVSAGTATITVSGTATDGYTAPTSKTFTVTVSDGSGGAAISNASTSGSENDMSLTKVLSQSGSGDDATYTITLTGKATAAASATYTVDGYGKKYSYSDLNTGNYYYLYNGTYYQVWGLKYYSSDKGKNYYCGYFVANETTYYLNKKPEAYSSSQLSEEHPGDYDSSKAYESCKEKDLSDGKKLPLYTVSGSSSGVGSSAYLRDTINTSLFDLSGASISSNPSSGVTRSLNTSTGAVSATGYNYSGNYGSQLVVTITGLKLKSGLSAGTYDSNNSVAAIYKSSSTSSSNLLVSASSPQITVTEAAEQYSYTLTYDANGGDESSAPANQTGNSADSSYTFVVTNSEPSREGYTFLGWSESNSATTPSYIAGESITVTKDSGASEASKTLYAVWEENASAGKYIDGTTQMETYGYIPTVVVTVDSSGIITDITATPGEAQGYSLQLFNDALAAMQEELIGKAASDAVINAFPSTQDSVDAVTGATYSVNALKVAVIKALSADNKIRWIDSDAKGGNVLDWAWYTTGTTPSYRGDSLGDTFKEWTPGITAVSGDKDYTAVYLDQDDYDLTVEDMVMSLEANPFSSGLSGGKWFSAPSSADEEMYAYPILTLTAGGDTIISNSIGYKADKYTYTYTSSNENVAKQYVVNGAGMPELRLFANPGRSNITLTIRDADSNVLATENFTVTVNPCTITWSVDETTTYSTVKVGGTPVSGLHPAKTGYTFLGWSTDPDATTGTEEADLPAADGNTTYYAIFQEEEQEENPYPDGTYGDYSESVEITKSDGTPIADYRTIVVLTIEDGKITDITVDQNDQATEDNLGYLKDAIDSIKSQLVGQNAVPSVIDGVDAVTGATYSFNALIAEIKAALADDAKGTYTVTFDADNGNSDDNKTETGVAYGTRTATLQPDPGPEKTVNPDDGYTYAFEKWQTEDGGDMAVFVTEDAGYKAAYTQTATEYTITYNLNGGTVTTESGEDGNPTTYTVETEDFTLINPEKENYTFAGWTGTDIDDTDPQTTVTVAKGSTGNRGYTATWTAATASYTVKHYQEKLDSEDYEGDERYEEVTDDQETFEGNAGEQTTAVAKEYEGFEAEDFEQETIKADGSTVVSIYYDREEYTITWKNWDDTVITSTTVKYGATPAYPVDETTPTREDADGYTYTFSGWEPELDTADGNTEYTATFTETAQTAVIQWKDSDGTVLQEDELVVGSTPEYKGTTPTKEADDNYTYEFIGWSTEEGATDAMNPLPTVTVDGATYYPVFQATAIEAEGHRIIFEDYTKGGVTISGLDTETLSDYDNCKVTTENQSGTVTFTLSASSAVAAAIHTDSDGMSDSKIKDQNGTYTRIYCTEEGGAYKFTVEVGEDDVYIVLAYKGDISLDGLINTVDASMAAKLDTGKYTGKNLQLFIGDVNDDNKNDTLDASMCTKADTGKRSHTWDTRK